MKNINILMIGGALAVGLIVYGQTTFSNSFIHIGVAIAVGSLVFALPLLVMIGLLIILSGGVGAWVVWHFIIGKKLKEWRRTRFINKCAQKDRQERDAHILRQKEYSAAYLKKREKEKNE